MLEQRSRPARRPGTTPRPPRVRQSAGTRRRRAVAAVATVAFLGAAIVLNLNSEEPRRPEDPGVLPGSAEWAERHYGNPDDPDFQDRNIVAIEFLGRTMFVHRSAARHFLRLESLFEARAPDYAAAVAAGTLDDWSYLNRAVRGGDAKSAHAFGIAIDINALTNPLGTAGDMPEEVVRQWEIEGGEWGGDWSRPDPMHFETRLTPEEIRERYRRDGSPRPWYLDQLIGG